MKIIFICQFILMFIFAVAAQTKQIAFTIDDLPLNGPQFETKRLRKMTEKLLDSVKKNKVPMVGFVNEGLLYGKSDVDERIEILKIWHNSGVELGNHTFSHKGFKDSTREEFEDDFIRGDSVTKMLVKPSKPRYFRHPFLQMGNTRELEDSFRKFIGERGYTAVPITMDTMDWMFLASYLKGLNEKDSPFQKQVSEDYLKFIGQKINSAEKISIELFGRNVKHILLLHANELNADNFDALIKIYRDKGYEFISVEEALKDEIYRFPEKYIPTSDWLSQWANDKGKRFETPQPPDYVQKIFNGK